MGKVVKQEAVKKEVAPVVEGFSLFRGKARMVRIKGNFKGGGFILSQNKARALLANKALIEKFARGDFDAEIDKLADDEMFVP